MSRSWDYSCQLQALQDATMPNKTILLPRLHLISLGPSIPHSAIFWPKWVIPENIYTLPQEAWEFQPPLAFGNSKMLIPHALRIPKSLTPTTPLLLYPDNSNFKHYFFSDFVSRDIFSKYLKSQHFFPEISSILLFFTYDCKYPVPPKTPDRTSWSQLTWNLHCIKRFIDSSEFADVWYRTNVVWCCVTFRDKTSPSYLSAHIKSIRTIVDNLEMKTARYIFVTGDCRAFPPTTGGSNYIGAEYKCYIKWIITKKGRYTD